MDKIIRFIVMAGVIAASLGAPIAAHAQSPLPPFCQEGSLPSNDPNYPDAAQLILICIPPNWNGQLIMYAHGYVPEQLPLMLPYEELSLSGGMFETLLSQGFAFATTSYHKNGYAVEQARKDLNDLLKYFKSQVPRGSLQKVFLIGASEGGEIATLMIEQFPDKYAGALAMCGPIGGAPYQIQYLSDFRVVFDYFFPDVFDFGVKDVPEDAFLNWGTSMQDLGTYMQIIPAAMASDPYATAQLYSVTGAPLDPGDPTTSTVSTALNVLYYSIWATNDLIATAGGMPFDNRSTGYLGSLNDTLLNAGVERVQSDGRARAYMRRYYQPTGNLQRPLVTLHNTFDPVVPVQHEYIYQDFVNAAGNGAFLTPIEVPTYGHCNFTETDINIAFTTLMLKVLAQP